MKPSVGRRACCKCSYSGVTQRLPQKAMPSACSSKKGNE